MTDEPVPPQRMVRYSVHVELADEDGDVLGTVDIAGGVPGENATIEVTGSCDLGPDSPLMVAAFFVTLANDIKTTGHMELDS